MVAPESAWVVASASLMKRAAFRLDLPVMSDEPAYRIVFCFARSALVSPAVPLAWALATAERARNCSAARRRINLGQLTNVAGLSPGLPEIDRTDRHHDHRFSPVIAWLR